MKQALSYSLDNEAGPVTIHTDCKSAVQALQTIRVKENKALIKDIRSLLYQHKVAGRQVTINWIPSHIGIPGNDKADELAKSTKYINNVQIKIRPTTSQVRNMMAPAKKAYMNEDIRWHANQGSPSASWYLLATDCKPHDVTKHTPRELAVIIHRLRIGYKANWQIIDMVDRPCNHCNTETDSPMLHYLLECPQAAKLRGNRILPDIRHPNSTNEAAILCRKITEEMDLYLSLIHI